MSDYCEFTDAGVSWPAFDAVFCKIATIGLSTKRKLKGSTSCWSKWSNSPSALVRTFVRSYSNFFNAVARCWTAIPVFCGPLRVLVASLCTTTGVYRNSR